MVSDGRGSGGGADNAFLRGAGGIEDEFLAVADDVEAGGFGAFAAVRWLHGADFRLVGDEDVGEVLEGAEGEGLVVGSADVDVHAGVDAGEGAVLGCGGAVYGGEDSVDFAEGGVREGEDAGDEFDAISVPLIEGNLGSVYRPGVFGLWFNLQSFAASRFGILSLSFRNKVCLSAPVKLASLVRCH